MESKLALAPSRDLACYDYVTVSYDRVREALRHDAVGLFQLATVAAAKRAQELAATLHFGIGPFDIGADVKIVVRSTTQNVSALGERTMIIDLAWTGAGAGALFPAMDARLAVYPLSRSETQLDLVGVYQPPLGVVGTAIDLVVGHRLARASVLRFVQEVATRLGAELS